MEVKRLKQLGLIVIDHETLGKLKDCKVLIRAHGEPPKTYKTALENNIELIDASCPVVLKLQNRVKNAYDNIKQQNGQLVIYGKQGHAEVTGLSGQTREDAIIISEDRDLDKIDYTKPLVLFSQTTKSTSGFYHVKELIEEKYKALGPDAPKMALVAHDSICRQVSNREPQLRKFAREQEVILFVSGKKSSNGKALFAACLSENPRSYFLESEKDINPKWLEGAGSVGICGATSTPMWLMKRVVEHLEQVNVL
jgi:4-hydroxy-3-methylbut-2-enyl diphosphate reductase